MTLRYTAETHGKAVVDRVMTSVKGGTVDSAQIMRDKLNADTVMDVATFQGWTRSIKEAPALINSQVIDLQSEADGDLTAMQAAALYFKPTCLCVG